MSAEEVRGRGDDAAAPEVTPRPMPRGVAAPDGTKAFVAGLADTVEAVDLERGERLWSAAPGGQPILATRDLVVVARPTAPSVLTLVALDAAGGGERQRFDLRFPPGVDAGKLPGRPGLRPSLRGERLVVEWRATGSYGGGAAPPESVLEAAARTTGGVFHCDLGAGAVEVMPLSAAATRPARPSWAYRRGGVWQQTAWWLDGLEATLELDRSAAEPALWLRTFDPGKSEPVAETPVASGDVEPTVTPDGRFLFVRQTAPPGGSWRIWRVSDHAPVGEIDYATGAELPALLGGRVYYLAPAAVAGGYELRALDLVGGRLLWRLALGSAAEAAPPPPPGKPPPGRMP